VTHPLPPRNPSAMQPWRPQASVDTGGGEIKPHQVIGLFVRHRWLVVGCAVAAAIVAAMLTASPVPVYNAAATIRIGDRDQNLPGIYKQLSNAAQVETEAEVLRGRILAADAVDSLALQFRLVAPVRLSRARLFDQIQVSKDAPTAVYELQRREDGRFRVIDKETGDGLAWVRPGEGVQLPGVSFRLDSEAASTPKLVVEVGSYVRAIEATSRSLQVYRPSRDALVLRLAYSDEDRDLAYQVPNLVVRRFIERRQESLQQDAHSTVEFLHRQIDTVALQLRTSEDSLRSYRERHHITDPEAEAGDQISRLMTLQAQRTTLDAERTALSQLLAEVDAKAAAAGSAEASPYRQLLAFPTLLQSRAATEVLQTLSNVEQERSVLLARRLPSDPDVQALTDRVNELQMQLRQVVVTYLQSLSNQVATLDAAVGRYQRELAAVPEKELEIARLARKPQVLAGLSSELQTRLKEAEIAQAARDPSVTLVDPAVQPLRPNASNRFARVLAGLLGGLILGVGVAVIKDARDKSVHTQSDLRSATGLPVLGLIPRISGQAVPVALIADKRPARAAPRQLPARSPQERAWTFLRDVSDDPADLDTESALAPQPSDRLVHIAASEVGGAVAEAYGILQTNIVFARSDRPVKIILLTSPLPGEGKTTSAINLALTLAQRGLKVLLIDADLRRGMLHGVFENLPGPGLSEVLEGKETFARAHGIAAVGQDYTMHYLTAGKPDGSPSGLVASHEMRGLLERLREEYDAIVVDSPPVNVVTDASLLASLADGVIVVARSGVTEPGALTCALEQLEHVGAPVLGMVLNDVDPKRDAAYGGSYRYHDYGRYAHSSGA
jgi:succinoglycan biosynthesis transport protein ExoP